jgi:hypothetical protein
MVTTIVSLKFIEPETLKMIYILIRLQNHLVITHWNPETDG